MMRPWDRSSTAETDTGSEVCHPSAKLSWLTWLALAGIIAAVAAAVWLLPVIDWMRSAVHFIDELDTWGVLVFVLLYALLATLAVPITPLNIASGLLFGAAVGFVAALGGAVSAAVVSFLLARYNLHNWVSRKLACYPRSSAILEGLEKHGWKTVLLVRLNPLIPASIKNYSFGVTDIPFWKYATATVLGQMPAVLLYSYLGSAGHLSLTKEGGLSRLDYVLYGAGLALAIIATAAITWYGKRSLDEHGKRSKTVP